MDRPADPENGTAAAKHETPATDKKPTAARALSIGLVGWILVGGAVLGLFSFLHERLSTDAGMLCLGAGS